MKETTKPRCLAAILLGVAVSACGTSSSSPVDPVDAAALDAGGDGAAMSHWASCTWQGGASTKGDTQVADTSADLSGVAIGAVPFDAAALRRKITVHVTEVSPDLVFGDAYIVRNSPTSEDAYLLASVVNNGTTHPCVVKTAKYRWLDANGTALRSANGDDDEVFLGGSVGVAGSDVYTDSCFGPNETGYLHDVKLAVSGSKLFSAVDTIEITMAEPFPTGDYPPGKLVPTAYDVGTCEGDRSIKVTASNTGISAVTVDTYFYSPTLLLDADGLPAGWFFLEPGEAATVAPGATVSLYGSLADTPNGNVTRLRAYTDFDSAQ